MAEAACATKWKFKQFICPVHFPVGIRVVLATPSTIRPCVDAEAVRYRLPSCFELPFPSFLPMRIEHNLDRPQCPWTCPPLSTAKNEKPLSSLSVGWLAADRKPICRLAPLGAGWLAAGGMRPGLRWQGDNQAPPARNPPHRPHGGCRGERCGSGSVLDPIPFSPRPGGVQLRTWSEMALFPKTLQPLPQLSVLSKPWLVSGLKVDENCS